MPRRLELLKRIYSFFPFCRPFQRFRKGTGMKRKRKSPTTGPMTVTQPTVMSRRLLTRGVELRNLTRAKMTLTGTAMNQQITILKTRPLFSLKFPANIVRDLMFKKQRFCSQCSWHDTYLICPICDYNIPLKTKKHAKEGFRRCYDCGAIKHKNGKTSKITYYPPSSDEAEDDYQTVLY